MTEAIAFDTHRFVKNLTASGFTEAQAEALADEQVHLLNSNLATKADIRGTKADIRGTKADIRATKADIRATRVDIRDTRVDLERVKSDLEVKIEQVRAGVETTRADLQRDIEKARSDLSRWMLTGWVAQTGLIATLFLYLFSVLPGG